MNDVYLKKICSDKDFKHNIGTFFESSYFDKIYDSDVDVYHKDSEGSKILFKLRKNVIPQDMQKEIISIFESHAKRKNDQRAVASGGKKVSILGSKMTKSDTIVRSNIAGYFDRPSITKKRHFKTNTVCRQTQFTRDNFDKWNRSLPFFEVVSDYYKLLAPEEFELQMQEIQQSPFQIGDTPFSTVTINHNFRTSCHQDKGDFDKGFGNLVVLGQDFEGGYLGFPQFKVAVDVRPGDLIIMDVHTYHCNTELILPKETSVRLSFVSYLRKDMVKCNKKTVIDGEIMYYKDQYKEQYTNTPLGK